MSNNIFDIRPLVDRLEKAAGDWPNVPASLGALLNEAADVIRMQDELIERPGTTPPEAGPTENTKSMARRLSAQAGWQDCTRCGAAILNVHPVGKPQQERPAFPASCPKCGHSTGVHGRDPEWKARCLNCNALIEQSDAAGDKESQ